MQIFYYCVCVEFSSTINKSPTVNLMKINRERNEVESGTWNIFERILNEREKDSRKVMMMLPVFLIIRFQACENELMEFFDRFRISMK